MRVKVEMIIETEDYGEPEFKKEIERLIEDIDPKSKLVKFSMKEEEE